MHPYSHDSQRTPTVLLGLAVAAILLAWGLDGSLHALGITPPWWLDTPAVAGFYGLLWRLYDQVLWRLPGHRQTFSGIPDYRGHWVGEIHSSHDVTRPFEAELAIRQTSSRILIELRTDRSASASQVALLCAEPGSSQGLQFLYGSRPRSIPVPAATAAKPAAELVRPMTPHEGTCRLTIDTDGNLTGDYQTDRHRGTYGILSFRERRPL